MRKYKYQACIIGRRGIEFQIVWASSESEAMNFIYEKLPQDYILKSIKRLD